MLKLLSPQGGTALRRPATRHRQYQCLRQCSPPSTVPQAGWGLQTAAAPLQAWMRWFQLVRTTAPTSHGTRYCACSTRPCRPRSPCACQQQQRQGRSGARWVVVPHRTGAGSAARRSKASTPFRVTSGTAPRFWRGRRRATVLGPTRRPRPRATPSPRLGGGRRRPPSLRSAPAARRTARHALGQGAFGGPSGAATTFTT